MYYLMFAAIGNFLSYIVFNMNEAINVDLVRLIFIYVKCIWIRMVSLFVTFYFRTYLWIFFLDIFIFLYVIIYTSMLFVIKNYAVINTDCIYLSEIFELLMLSLQSRHSSNFCLNQILLNIMHLCRKKLDEVSMK